MTAVTNDSIASAKHQHSLWARIGAEFAGSLLICFTIYVMVTFGTVFFNANLAYIALGTGVVYAAMTAIFGKISGGQFNPAVTVAAILTARTRVLDGILYVVAQVLGSIAAAGIFVALLPTSETIQRSQWLVVAVNGYGEGSSMYSNLSQMGLTYSATLAIVVELVASIIVVAAAMQSLKQNGAPTRQHTVVMGLAYAAATGLAYPITGAAINPIRPTGIAVFSSNQGLTVNPLSQLWVFWVSAILAAALVALVMIVAQLIARPANSTPDVAQVAMEQADSEVDDNDTPTVADETSDTPISGLEADAEYSVVEQEDAQVEEK